MENEFKIIDNVNENLLKQLVELDKSVYKKSDMCEIDICKNWLSVNKDIYTVLLYNNKAIGYINFMPITKDCYDNFAKGAKKDYQIKCDEILPFSKIGVNNCLLASIVIHKDFQNGVAIKYLFNGFKEKLLNFAKDNIKISKIIFDCVSVDGEKFVKKYFDAKLIRVASTGKIYERKLNG